jgi:formylglycine-generating enzyme
VRRLAFAALLLLCACAGRPGAPAGRTQCLASGDAGMVHLAGGVFEMGARPLGPDEGPPHPVRVKPFWIDRTDVTNAQFARFVAATGYVTLAERALDPARYPDLSPAQRRPSAIVFVGAAPDAASDPSAWWRVVPGADWRHPEGPGSTIRGKDALPVVQIAYDDALAYARWRGHDLPTEAEWEYAAQGGRGPHRFIWGDEPFNPAHPQANVWQGVFPALDTGEDGYRMRPSPVGCFPANGYGLYDMVGNVWQWTADVAGLERGLPRHVIKGGSFLCSPDYCYRYRPAAREAGPADTGEDHIGFRTVRRD